MKLFGNYRASFVLALAVLLSGCMSVAERAQRERDSTWHKLQPDEKARLIATSCSTGEERRLLGEKRTTYTGTFCKRFDEAGRGSQCHDITIGPVMSPDENLRDMREEIAKTCATLKAIKDPQRRYTYETWCATFVPTLLPKGITMEEAKPKAVACYVATLRGLRDAALQSRGQCCKDRIQIGSNGVWKCLQAETEKVLQSTNVAHANIKCEAALGGVAPFGAALWCGVCPDPQAFLRQLLPEAER